MEGSAMVPGELDRNSPVMRRFELVEVISDPSGPEVATSRMSNPELGRLLNAVFLHLDTPSPFPSALSWYRAAAAESRRRS